MHDSVCEVRRRWPYDDDYGSDGSCGGGEMMAIVMVIM